VRLRLRLFWSTAAAVGMFIGGSAPKASLDYSDGPPPQSQLRAAPAQSVDAVLFVRDVQPILRQHCYWIILNCNASATASAPMASSPARSAIVRATLRTRS
jgi:hypothetical protein